MVMHADRLVLVLACVLGNNNFTVYSLSLCPPSLPVCTI